MWTSPGKSLQSNDGEREEEAGRKQGGGGGRNGTEIKDIKAGVRGKRSWSWNIGIPLGPWCFFCGPAPPSAKEEDRSGTHRKEVLPLAKGALVSPEQCSGAGAVPLFTMCVC